MEPKKDISIYRTDNKLSKGHNLSRVHNDKAADTETNIAEYDFNVFINKKTKKLTTALYMVTSFLSDSEPLKWKLRERSVSLFSGVSNVRNKSVSEVDNVFAGYSVLVDEIVSLLEVAAVSKLISEMNFLILKKEYNTLKDIIDSNEYTEEKSGRFMFADKFFEEDGVLPQLKEKDSGIDVDDNVYMEKESTGLFSKTDKQKKSLMDKRHNFDKGQSQQMKTVKDNHTTVGKNQKPANTKMNRRDTIVRLFKNRKGKEFTIKDITHEVSGCSEKTIQRELISLVAEGVIKKRGERRWSRYSIK